VRGPVGSLERPADEEDFERFDAEGIALYVHREVLVGSGEHAQLDFDFGMLGRCKVSLGIERGGFDTPLP
jgi:hypothetical protein